MIHVLAGLLATVQISEARVVVELNATGVAVTAEYIFANPPARVSFDAIKWPRQTISGTNFDVAALNDLGGLYRIAIADSARLEYRLTYVVSGNAQRIPLFVPNAFTEPGMSDVTIVIRNVPADVKTVDAFPRFVRAEDGTLVARPANIPSFVLVPVAGGLSKARIADSLVLLLIVASSCIWIVRKVRLSA